MLITELRPGCASTVQWIYKVLLNTWIEIFQSSIITHLVYRVMQNTLVCGLGNFIHVFLHFGVGC